MTALMICAFASAGVTAAQDSSPRYGDSATFDPGGYYLPATELVSRGDTVLHFEVRTIEYYYDGSLHYNRPRLLSPRANVVIARGSGERTRHDCTVLAASPAGLGLACETPIGDLTLEANYLDKRGRYWNIIEYELGSRVVAQGRLLIRRPGLRPESWPVDLVYTAGH